MPQRPTMLRASSVTLLDVVLRAGGDVAEDELLGDAAAERDLDLAQQVGPVVAEAVGLGRRQGDAERDAARDDRDLAHRVGAGREHPDERMAGLVVGGAAALLGLSRMRRSVPRMSFSSASSKSAIVTASWSRLAASSAASLTTFARSAPTMPGRGGGEPVEVDVVGERHRARVDVEDLAPAGGVGRLEGDAAVEAPGAQQRRVEHLGAVGRAEHDHADRGVEAVHLGEDLVERLLALVVAAADAAAGPAGAADRVELVDEDDRRRGLLGLREQVAHARGADADEHLDELRGGDREERHLRLAGQRARQQRLARARRAGQQHAARDPAAEAAVLVRVA